VFAIDLHKKKYRNLLFTLHLDYVPRLVLFRHGHAVNQLKAQDGNVEGLRRFFLQTHQYSVKAQMKYDKKGHPLKNSTSSSSRKRSRHHQRSH
jgi:hypothetical protein